MQIRLWFRQLNGTEFSLKADVRAPVHSLKKQIVSKFRHIWPTGTSEEIHLMHSRNELSDEETVESANLLDDTRIVCCLDNGSSIPMEDAALAQEHDRRARGATDRKEDDVEEEEAMSDHDMDVEMESKEDMAISATEAPEETKEEVLGGLMSLPVNVVRPHASIENAVEVLRDISTLKRSIHQESVHTLLTYWGTIHTMSANKLPKTIRELKETVVEDAEMSEYIQPYSLVLVKKLEKPFKASYCLVRGYIDDSIFDVEYNKSTLRAFCTHCERHGCFFQPRPLCRECGTEAVMMQRTSAYHCIKVGTKGTFGDLMNVRAKCMNHDCEYEGLVNVAFVCKGNEKNGNCPSRDSNHTKFQHVYSGLGKRDMRETLLRLWGSC